MIVAGSASPLLLASAGYNLTRSLRFRSSASAYLNRTPASAGNRRTFTYSTWVKRGSLGNAMALLSGGSTGGTGTAQFLGFDTNDTFFFSNFGIGNLQTTQVFRDPSAWYHVVLAFDTTQATASNRIKMYVNGSQITSFSSSVYPAQNTDLFINTNQIQAIGRASWTSLYLFDGYLTEVNFIDGQALTPSSFGANNASTGVWQPKKYAGTYGTNGFYLPFTNNSTTTTLGNDFSGNGNNWTTNNISLTAGSTYDSMTDVPTLTSPTAANYCVLNILGKVSTATITNANLTINNSTGGSFPAASGTIFVSSGKWYFETTYTGSGTAEVSIGLSIYPTLVSRQFTGTGAGTAPGTTYFNSDQGIFKDGTVLSGTPRFTFNDVIGIAYDADAGTVTYYKNNVSQTPVVTGITGSYSPTLAVNFYANGTLEANFGQRPFAYTPPTGFVALNTFNLPTPTIGATASTQANKYMDATLATGNNSTQVITNAGGFQPDLVWMKIRSSAENHILYDSVRGVTNYLTSNLTLAEGATAQGLTSFNSNGFTLGSANPNYAGSPTFVAWQWRANGTPAVTNTAGSITSTVSANTSAGFSVVTYTGTGSAATVGHGLGATPRMIIVKSRSAVTNWAVFHVSLGSNGLINLNTTATVVTDNNVFNATPPTSSVFSVGASSLTNTNTATYVAYCFSEVAGYSKFGSYTGNGSADGQFIYTGFRPRFVMVKQTGFVNDWGIFDSSRNPSNAAQNILYPNLSNAEGVFSAGTPIDFLSNGFKLYGNSLANSSAGGGGYIYAAFAESPFKYANAR